MAWASLAVAAVSAWGMVESSKNKAKTGAAGMPGMGGSMGMETQARSVDAIFDNSGWNVSFGSSKIDSVADKTLSQTGASAPVSPAMGVNQPVPFGLSPYAQSAPFGLSGIDQNTLLYAGIGLALVIAWKKKSS